MLTRKALEAADRERIGRLVLCGGVAANSRLRTVFEERARAAGLQTFVPPPRLCTDNAAMIAVAGTYLLERGERATFDLDANPAALLQ